MGIVEYIFSRTSRRIVDPLTENQVSALEKTCRRSARIDVKRDRQGRPVSAEVSVWGSPVGHAYGNYFEPAGNAHRSTEFKKLMLEINSALYPSQEAYAEGR